MKKKKTGFQLRRKGTNKNTNKHIWTEGKVNGQTCCFPSLTLSCPGETARGGQALLDTLPFFMATYFKACMFFGDCRTWSTSHRQPCASPGFLPPGATRVCRDGEWSGKTRAEEQTCEGVKADLGHHWLALAPLSPLFLWLAITHRWSPRRRLATVLHLIRSATRTRRKNGKRTSLFNEGRKKEEPTCLIWCEKAQFCLMPTRTFWGQSVLHNVWHQELHTPWQNKSEVGPS